MNDRQYLNCLNRAHEHYHNVAGRPDVSSPAFHDLCDAHNVEVWELADMIADSAVVERHY